MSETQYCEISKVEQMSTLGAAIRDLLSIGPVKVSIGLASEKRRALQNRLAFHWYYEAAQQGDNDKAYYRAYCKLHHGVAIAKEDDVFAEQYDKIIKPLAYEDKLKAMVEPFELPVTSRFSIKQMNTYLNNVQQDLSAQGLTLTTSEDLYYKAMGIAR